MSLHNLWNIFICLVISSGVEAKGRIRSGDDTDIMDATAGEKFIIRTWSLIGANLSVSLKVGNNIRLSGHFSRDDNRTTTVQHGSLALKYNFTSKEVSLMFENIDKKDEGLYKLEENFHRTELGSSIDFERKYGTWSFQLNVIEPNEVNRGNVGDNIVMDFEKVSEISTLYHYEQTVAHLVDYDCAVWTNTQFYGRLSCTNDDSNKKNMIIIQNVTQRDAGLYKVVHDTKESRRRFLEIKDRPTFATIGENVSIGWFYKEQGERRTLRILHPNKEVMFIVHPNNSLRIASSFQQRVSDFGIIPNYVSFTLLKIKSLDSGFYTIETLYGNNMTGQKQLIVQDPDVTSPMNFVTTVNTGSTVAPLSNVSTKGYSCQPVVTDGTALILANDLVTSLNESSTEQHLHQPSTELRSLAVGSTTPEVQGLSPTVTVPLYAIPVVAGAVGVIVVMIGCLIWIQRKNSYSLEAVQRLVEECETASFATPSTLRRSLPMPPGNEETTGSGVPQSNTFYNVIRGLHRSDIMLDSVSIDTACSTIYSLAKSEDNDKRLDNIVNLNEPGDSSDQKISAACDNDTEEYSLEESPSVCTLVSAAGNEEHNYSHIADGHGERHVFQRIQSLYAKVKKGPRFSFINSNDCADTGKTDGLCGDAYEMVDISRSVDPDNTLQESNTYAESTKNQTPVSEENDSLAIKEEEPTEQKMTSGVAYNDYADIDL